mgnify:FL=1|tara:strand:+ start:1016 stop:1378 length:363 start_codon:yes stop_codon:yes gene_type:complete
MPTITLTFTNPINSSVCVGDTAYYTLLPTTTGGFQTSTQSDIVEIGSITSINNTTNQIVCDTNLTFSQQPTTNSFILFSKNNKANLSTVLGYFGETKFKNSSTIKSELFSIGTDMFVSSK